MGVIVGRNAYSITCNDPHGKGCRAQTEEFHDQTKLERHALHQGWYKNDMTGYWHCHLCHTTTSPIRISREDWWKELGERNLPEELVALLRGLVNTFFRDVCKPTATPALITLARQHLSGGLVIDNSPYEICIWVPQNERTHKHIFVLVPSCPNATLRRLIEFN